MRNCKHKPTLTRDGVEITLLHNSGLVADLPMLDETGAAGVGLFRTELQFMIASKLPRLTEQVELYSQAMEVAGDRPIVFRLLDIGGDKVVPYMRSAAEENPAMGWRSLGWRSTGRACCAPRCARCCRRRMGGRSKSSCPWSPRRSNSARHGPWCARNTSG